MRLSLVFSRRTSMVSFIPPLLHSSFVERLRVPASTRERLQAERVLAVARIIIVLFALVAAHFDPTEPTRYAPIVFGLLVIYASFALAVLALLHFGEISRLISPPSRLAWPSHGNYFDSSQAILLGGEPKSIWPVTSRVFKSNTSTSLSAAR